MTKRNVTWLKCLALSALLPATMANKGGCSPDVDMGSDETTAGGASVDESAAVGGKGGASVDESVAVGGKGGASVDESVAVGGKGGTPVTESVAVGGKGGTPVTESVAVGGKGGASVTESVAVGGKGGTTPYLKCTSKDGCGPQPKAEACANGSSPPMECVGSPDGQCVWNVLACSPKASCSSEMCGKQPDFKPCEGDLPGGVICEPDAAGVCGWQQHCSEIPMCLPKCGPEPTERGSCPDGTLKAIYCKFEDPMLKYVPCSEYAATKPGWVEQACPISIDCEGVDEVVILPRYLAKYPDTTKYSSDPADARALCKEAFRQPALPSASFYCVTEKEGYGYELLFIDRDAVSGTLGLKALVFPKGECSELTTTEAAAMTLRMPSQGLWDQFSKVLGVDIQQL